MPIRESERHRYPADWIEISKRIRAREGNQCKWCGAPNLRMIARDPSDPFKWRLHECNGVCVGEGHKAIRVILTVAHLDHTPENCAESNLVALCQRCHLRYDSVEHRRNARLTRDAKRGQRRLFE
jgi:hypothetical protein